MSTNIKNKGGAPQKAPDEKMNKDLRCKVNKPTKEWVDKKAKEAGYKKTSDYIRHCVMSTVQPKVAMPSKRFLASSRNFFSNHRQLMRHLNTYKAVIDDEAARLLAQHSNELTKELRRLRAEIQYDLSNDVIMTLAINRLTLCELDIVRETVEAKRGLS